MLVLPVDLALLDKSEGGLVPTPGADVLQAVEDLLILTVLLGERKDRKSGTGGHRESAAPSCPAFACGAVRECVQASVCMCMSVWCCA